MSCDKKYELYDMKYDIIDMKVDLKAWKLESFTCCAQQVNYSNETLEYYNHTDQRCAFPIKMAPSLHDCESCYCAAVWGE